MRVAASVTIPMAAAAALVLLPAAGPSIPMGSPFVRPVAADSLNDGPHVYWQTPSDAVVFYLCDGVVLTKRYAPSDTLRFTGFCSDSTWQYVIPVQAPGVEPDTYERVPKIFAISDIHGEFEPLVDLLEASGVIDEGMHWNWGAGHLVVNGDTFDRGGQVTECLWLFYRLELEARAAGGRVHFLLGNHETMVLRRDLRYVNEKYTNGIVRATQVNYTDLFGPDMELGRWLRTKHTAIKLNRVLFVHGGIPPRLVARGASLGVMNDLARGTLDSRSYEIAFDDELRKHYGHSDEGPFWYRGYHRTEEGRYPQATGTQVDSILDAYDSRAIVVGHTGVDRVMSLYEGRVFALDVPLEELGSFQGLLWDGDRFFRVTGDGSLEPLEGTQGRSIDRRDTER